MKPVHYTITSFGGIFRAKYLDETGESKNYGPGYGDPTQASQEFKVQHKNAVYLKPDDFRKDDFRKLENQAANERELLAKWKSQAAISGTPAPRRQTPAKPVLVQESWLEF